MILFQWFVQDLIEFQPDILNNFFCRLYVIYQGTHLTYFKFTFIHISLKHPFFSPSFPQQLLQLLYTRMFFICPFDFIIKIIFHHTYRCKFF